jgi:hypothetical protein
VSEAARTLGVRNPRRRRVAVRSSDGRITGVEVGRSSSEALADLHDRGRWGCGREGRPPPVGVRKRDRTVDVFAEILNGPDCFNDDHQSALSVKRPTPI